MFRITEEEKADFLILVSDKDIMGRREQNELLIWIMETHVYKKSQIRYQVMNGYEHVGYENERDEKGKYPYFKMLEEFIATYNIDSLNS